MNTSQDRSSAGRAGSIYTRTKAFSSDTGAASLFARGTSAGLAPKLKAGSSPSAIMRRCSATSVSIMASVPRAVALASAGQTATCALKEERARAPSCVWPPPQWRVLSRGVMTNAE